MKLPVNICPSILSADFANLSRDLKIVEQAGATRIHLDVMDGHFVPNITFGPPLVRSIRKATDRILEAHLMVSDAVKWCPEFADAGADIVLFHVEVQPDPDPVFDLLRDMGVEIGLVINPDTPADAVMDHLEKVSMILVMSVYPGFGGQAFMPQILDKVRAIRARADQVNPSMHIQIDGGINENTAPKAVQAGADLLVAGSAVFGQEDPGKAFINLQNIARGAVEHQ